MTTPGAPHRPDQVGGHERTAAKRRRLRFGYGTNGLADHRLADALAFLADTGYDGVALTLDHMHLDPQAGDLPARVKEAVRLLGRYGLAVVVETGARFVLDPRHKHQPTLVSGEPEGRRARLDLLRTAVAVGADLGAEAVSFWSGAAPPGTPASEVWDRLVAGCEEVCQAADEAGVVVGCEPEPGMVVGDLDGWSRLAAALGDPPAFGVTLDIGHLRCTEADSEPECIRRLGPRIVNVQAEDMRRGAHEHLPFGEGEVDLPGALGALHQVGYEGLVSVELPRDSHRAASLVPTQLAALRLAEAIAGVHHDPASITTVFPAVGRIVGRGPASPEHPGGPLHTVTVDDNARARLLDAVVAAGGAGEVEALYRHGDRAERRGVLRWLGSRDDIPAEVPAAALAEDALRTNDPALLAAAVGPSTLGRLDPVARRHAILRCAFAGVGLDGIVGLRRWVDPELLRMLAGYAEERKAAGRDVPEDVLKVMS